MPGRFSGPKKAVANNLRAERVLGEPVTGAPERRIARLQTISALVASFVARTRNSLKFASDGISTLQGTTEVDRT
jgi:hypothetical protein